MWRATLSVVLAVPAHGLGNGSRASCPSDSGVRSSWRSSAGGQQYKAVAEQEAPSASAAMRFPRAGLFVKSTATATATSNSNPSATRLTNTKLQAEG